jgi:hypothetical protein
MESSTGGDSGTPGGGITQHQLTGQSSPLFSSTLPAAGLDPSRLLALFKECVDNGVWASLETIRRRGAVSVEFCCRLEATTSASSDQAPSTRRRNRPNARKRARNVERTREWRESRQQCSQQPPASAARSFAAVAAQPVPVQTATTSTAADAKAVKAVPPTAAGNKRQKAKGPNPTKRAKSILVASRTSQRAAILSKKRAAATNDKEKAGATPESLRGIDGIKALDLSLGSPSPPPPPLLLPLTPEAVHDAAGDSDSSESGIAHRTDETEEDFHQDVWEDGHRLNTQEPSWERVFPFAGVGSCRFCHRKSMPDPVVDDTREYECEDCFKLTTLQLIVKHASRSKYPVT